MKWNSGKKRWQILRRNPIRPNLKPDLVFTWQADSGQFLPLDNRIFHFIQERDMERKFRNRDRRYWGALLDAEMLEKEAKARAAHEKFEREQFEKLEDGLNFMFRNDRRRIKPETVNP